eukprot:Gb_20696 [translate_table: standard]
MKPHESTTKSLSGPGPGDYYPTPTTGHSPSFTIGSKLQNPLVDRESTPGPSEYYPRTRGKSPSFTLGRKVTPSKNRPGTTSPGPAAYFIVPNSQTTVPTSPAFSLGTKNNYAANQNKNDGGPGPATYYPHAKPMGPRFNWPYKRGSNSSSKDSVPASPCASQSVNNAVCDSSTPPPSENLNAAATPMPDSDITDEVASACSDSPGKVNGEEGKINVSEDPVPVAESYDTSPKSESLHSLSVGTGVTSALRITESPRPAGYGANQKPELSPCMPESDSISVKSENSPSISSSAPFTPKKPEERTSTPQSRPSSRASSLGELRTPATKQKQRDEVPATGTRVIPNTKPLEMKSSSSSDKTNLPSQFPTPGPKPKKDANGRKAKNPINDQSPETEQHDPSSNAAPAAHSSGYKIPVDHKQRPIKPVPVANDVYSRKPSGSPQYNSLPGRIQTCSRQPQLPGPGTGSYTVLQQKPNGSSYSTRKRTELPTRPRSPFNYPKPTAAVIASSAQCSSECPEDESRSENEPCHADSDLHDRYHQARRQHTLGNKAEIPKPSTNVPSPGSYSAIHRSNSPAFSLGGRNSRNGRRNDRTPGFGNYDTDSHKSNSPKLNIAGKPQNNTNNKSPGPGSYENRTHATGKDSPSYSLSGRPAEDTHRSINPGPGAYTLGSTKEGPAYTLCGKKRESGPDSRPGPGTYDASTRCTSPTSPSYYMGERIEIKTVDPEETPGPGAYIVHVGHEGPAFSMLPRLRSGAPNNNPGPGTYDASLKYSSSSPRSPSYTLGATLSGPKQESISPGPAKYNPQLGHTGPAYSLTGKRVAVYGSLASGPGTYEPDQLPHGLAYTMAGRLTEKQREQSPGPGTYDPKLIYDSPAFSIYGRSPERIHNDVPGPGTYDNTGYNDTGPAFSFGSRLDPSRSRESSPGPATYDPVLTPKSPAFSFGDKFPPLKKPNVPGPGAYDPVIKSASPAFSLYGRFSSPTRSDISPGPAVYSPRRKPDGPYFSLGGKAPELPIAPVPGPGAYKTSGNLCCCTAPSFSLGGRLPAVPDKRTEVPGPGAYPMKPQTGGPSFSIHGKPQILIETNTNTPGPGAYAVGHMKTGGPSFSMSGKFKDMKSRDLSPGPETYHSPRKSLDGPAHSFVGRDTQASGTATKSLSSAPNFDIVEDEEEENISNISIVGLSQLVTAVPE